MSAQMIMQISNIAVAALGEKEQPAKRTLADQCPDLAAEWDYIKNGDLTPKDVMPGSHKKVWWTGKCGHEWQAKISNRVSGNGCPICAKERQTSFAEQAIYFYIKQVFSDAVNGDRTVLDGKELDIYIPSICTGVEYDGKAWHKDAERDNEKNLLCEEKGVKLIRVREVGCPALDELDYLTVISRTDNTTDESLDTVINEICTYLGCTADINISRDRSTILSMYIHGKEEKSLAVKYPQLAAEWNYKKNGALTPEMVTVSSHKKVWWICEKGHEWQAAVADRTNGNGCPICGTAKMARTKSLAANGIDDLATTHPELASEWHPEKNAALTPEMVKAGSAKTVWWRCSKGHEWQARIAHRSNGAGCPYCTGRAAIPGETDLATTHPELTKEWDYAKNATLTPEMVKAGSHKKVWWIGKCGHEWQTSIDHRSRGTGCPVCAGLRYTESAAA